MKETEKFYLFWKHQFGQWTKRDMVDIDGTVYNCCEQYMMAKKAQLFGDIATLAQIMGTESPQKQKDFGRTVSGFDQKRWNQYKYAIVWQANYLKFSQHSDLRQRLLATADKILAEASPMDLVWGIGYAAEDVEAVDQSIWRGQNLLGEALMSVRQALKVAGT